MTGSAAGFARGRLGLYHLLAKPASKGDAKLPLRRNDLYARTEHVA